MKKLIFLFCLFAICLSAEEVPEEVFQFENLRIVKKPTILRIPISNDFLCDKAIPLQTVDLMNIAGISSEAGLFLQCSQSSEELVAFYEKVFLSRDWRILQKDNKENKHVILGENSSKKVLTVLIRDDKDHRIVKIFFRRPNF